MNSRISIAGYSFHGALAEGTLNVYSYFETCRYRYHLDTADLWCGLLGNDPDVYLQRETLLKVKAEMQERGLELVNYHADGCHIWEDDPEARRRHRILADRHIAAAELLGARTVRIDAGGRERHWTGEQFELIAGTYKAWARRAQDRGYKIGPETHWGAENHVDNMLKLAGAVDEPAYGILLHMGKEVDGPAEDYDKALAPLAVHTHIDQRTTENRAESALRILADCGYRGALGVEHHSGRNEAAEVAAQLELVRRAVSHVSLNAASAGHDGNPLLDSEDERSANV
jgi:sugar phosphate isomerase/epimerase